MSRLGWKDRLGDEAVCIRCGETRDSTEVDRMLWCEVCRAASRHRAGRVGMVAGALTALLLAWYIREAIRPTDLVIGGWAACVIAAGWIASKITKEVAYGIFRSFPDGQGS